MKRFICLLLVSLITLGLSGCGKKEYKDGTYIGEIKKEELDTVNPGDSSVEITIKDGKIVDCKFIAKDQTGKVKDKDYGKDSGDQNYKKAQKAVLGIKQYPSELIKVQDIDKVDALSGATVSHKIFVDATKRALEKAEK